MPAISVTDLSVGYKNSPIISDIHLQLNTGKIICLLGPNGAGKTTLMKTLLGRIKPVGGHISYDQTDISEMSAAIDHPSYFPYLSGKQNVQVVSAFWGLDVDPESEQRRHRPCCPRAESQGLLDRYEGAAGTLSCSIAETQIPLPR
ncbi:ATP-binding cassette domain-containing protein [Actinomyces trachealis]|uniref:ATP-binding cassette domain-containing protein n=1 Tax=Actinomyces trachealis TaxID=2763540 RepID=UPI0024680A01|nr:ATP-binding cassette domain-containing protein [Actinomyces trachealis]